MVVKILKRIAHFIGFITILLAFQYIGLYSFTLLLTWLITLAMRRKSIDFSKILAESTPYIALFLVASIKGL